MLGLVSPKKYLGGVIMPTLCMQRASPIQLHIPQMIGHFIYLIVEGAPGGALRPGSPLAVPVEAIYRELSPRLSMFCIYSVAYATSHSK